MVLMVCNPSNLSWLWNQFPKDQHKDRDIFQYRPYIIQGRCGVGSNPALVYCRGLWNELLEVTPKQYSTGVK